MIHVCFSHVIIDRRDQHYRNLLDSRGHYVTPIEMSNQLGLIEYICVKNCLILVVFLISQP